MKTKLSSVNFLPLIMHSSMYPVFRLMTTMVVLASCINRNLTLVKLQILTFLTLNPLEFTIVSNMSHSLYIVLVYRPYPSPKNKLTSALFLEEFDNFTDYLDILPGKVLLLGDFNVHFDCPEKSDVKRFKTSLDNIGLIQHVSQPTHRCGSHS